MPGLTVALSTYGFLLNGRWIDDGPVLPVRSPYTGETVAHVVAATKRHAEEAIAAAVEAFAVTRRIPAYERQRVLQRVSDQMASRSEEFARMMALEAGKPIKTARG